jgi:hypothetical protein
MGGIMLAGFMISTITFASFVGGDEIKVAKFIDVWAVIALVCGVAGL